MLKKFRPNAEINRIKISIVLILALVAGFSIYWALMQVYQPVPVVVAGRDIDTLTQLTETDLRVVQMAKRDVHPKMFSDVSRVVGTYAAVPLTKGEPILSTKVVGDIGKLSSIVKMKKKETFIVLKQQEASWPSFLKDGDLVTVVAFYKDTLEVVDEAVARVVSSSKPVPVVTDLKSASEGQQAEASITLAMSVDDAHRVVKALNTAASVRLLPRHPALGGYDVGY